MHTVIIAEKHLIDDINNNPTFFGPFLSRGDVVSCAWDPLEDKVENAVPDLEKIVSEYSDWRAIVVCDESSLKKKDFSDADDDPADPKKANDISPLDKMNPFDVVGYVETEGKDRLENDELDSFIADRHQLRLATFKCASKQPLTQLVTLLCEEPETSDGIVWKSIKEESQKNQAARDQSAVGDNDHNTGPEPEEQPEEVKDDREVSSENRAETEDQDDQENTDESDFPDELKPDDHVEIAEYENYREEAQRKHELREEILKGTPEHFNRPSQLLCIAKRDYTNKSQSLKSNWSSHLEIQYSDFYNYNLYFDKMRYLLLDVSSGEGENRHIGDFKFLYTLLLIACNPLPENCLHANRVYLAESVYDQAAFEKTLTEYYAQLTATIQHIEEEVQSLSNASPKPISDKDAENLLHSHVTIPVSLTTDFDKDTLYADYAGIGLSSDCPSDEMCKWNSEEKKTTNALMRYLKQPRRAIKKAARDAREKARPDEDAASRLDEFQTDDLEAVMENHEIEMVSAGIPNVFDEKRYRESIDEAGEAVRAKTRTRMSRKCTIGVGVCVLVLFLIGLLPMWLGSLSEPLVIPGALIMMAVALVLLAATGFVCLFFLRHGLIQKWKDYNHAMQEVVDEIDGAVGESSRYLSLVCRFMQEHAALEWAKNHEIPNKSKCMLLERHLSDIYNQRESICNIFGDLVDKRAPELGTPIYDYNFLSAHSYEYPLPENPSCKQYITFMESDFQVEVPYKLIKSLTVRREEIYD